MGILSQLFNLLEYQILNLCWNSNDIMDATSVQAVCININREQSEPQTGKNNTISYGY